MQLAEEVRSPKACEANCPSASDRIWIQDRYAEKNLPQILLAVVFVFAPVVLMPVVALVGYLAYCHLRLMGATNVKTLVDFLPDRKSHRYSLKTQILPRGRVHPAAWIYTRTRLYWILNCTWYCPYSVALFEWCAYLSKAIESWWCPFAHSKKHTYETASLDASYWHATGNAHRLHWEDRNDPTWTVSPDAPPESGLKGAEAAAPSSIERRR